jgi:ATP-dependent helicase/nuclease subunit B
MRKEFLGWEQSMLRTTAEWLWQHRAALPDSIVVVPTSQAGRRLRGELAAMADRQSTAIFGLRVVTPAFFLQLDDPNVADESVEWLAWIDVLEKITDWTKYAAAFPHPPEMEGMVALAHSLAALRRNLQEAGLLIRDAARPLMSGGDTERWAALSLLEEMVEKTLRDWGYVSRNQALRDISSGRTKLAAVKSAKSIILAGITEASDVAWRQWESHADCVLLLGTGEEHEAMFDARGIPQSDWLEFSSPFPGRQGMLGGVSVAASGRSLAQQCVARVAELGVSAKDLALVSCDAELDEELAVAFAQQGWVIHRPGKTLQGPHSGEWLQHWISWIKDPDLGALARMVPMPETSCLTSVPAKDLAAALCEMRDQWLVRSADDVERLASVAMERRPMGMDVLRKALAELQAWRNRFLQGNFATALDDLMGALVAAGFLESTVAYERMALFDGWENLRRKVQRPNVFWLELLCSDWPQPQAEIPAERVLDLQGWLEAGFEDSPHLILCGMSDGCVPSSPGSDPWLGESARKILQLVTSASRAARDAYLFHSLCACRAAAGRVDVFLAKTASDGSVRRPSRILLQAQGVELAERVRHVFAHVEQPSADLTWQADWQWQIPWDATIGKATDSGKSISVTALRDYLACPFRFYLKHGLRLQSREPERGEWNARNFGDIMHLVLENWGKNTDARALDDETALADWLDAELEKLVRRNYGEKPAIAIVIQQSALAHRLRWFAEKQCLHYRSGWRLQRVEVPFSLAIGQWMIRGTIDRIDRHESTGEWHLWDYKSGNLRGGIIGEHSKKWRNPSSLPAHIADDSRMFHPDGKTIWTNLQLPLYAASKVAEQHPEIGYVVMGESESSIQFDPWPNYDETLTQSALSCAEMILEMIDARKFWPPSEKPKYDDYAFLAAGGKFPEMMSQPPSL